MIPLETKLYVESRAGAHASDALVLLRVEGLRKSFGGQIVLDDLDLELRQGEVVLLRGENGSGKTTLLNILTGTLEPDAGTISYMVDDTPRSYRFPRRWWEELNPLDHFTCEFVAQEGVCRTWQETRLFGSQTLRENIAVSDRAHPGENPLLVLFAPGRWNRHESELNRRADAVLAGLGLAGREGSTGDEISLGQSKRVSIARAVATGTRILFLDEPLAGLDGHGIRDVLDLLGSLVRDRGMTLVIVEHVENQAYLRELATTDWLLAEGTIRCTHSNEHTDNTERVFTPTTVSPVHRPDWWRLLVEEGAEVVDEPLPQGALLTRIRRPATFNSWKPVLEVRDLLVKRGLRSVIGVEAQGKREGFDLTLHEGEIAVLQAPNGWGKTTLISAIAGLIGIDHGDISLGGRSLNGLATWDRVKMGLSVLLSDSYVFPSLHVREVLNMSGNPTVADEFRSLAGRAWSALSGGQKQLLMVLAQMGPRLPEVLQIYDEPFSALDGDAVQQVARFIVSQTTGAVLICVPYSTRKENLLQ